MTIKSIFTQSLFRPKDKELAQLADKVAIVTGASAGIGLHTASALAKQGARVFCIGRNKEKMDLVVENIKKESGNDKVESLISDFLDLNSVEKVANEFLEKKLPCHILVNNAGIMNPPFALSKQNIESQMATNHFAHVLLTSKLLPVIENSQPSRIVNVSSLAHTQVKGIDYDSFNKSEKYTPSVVYAETKLANIHFTKELQDRLEEKYQNLGKECRVYVNAVHPGVIKSDLWKHTNPGLGGFLLNAIFIDSEKGSKTQIYVAASPEIEKLNKKGRYFVPYYEDASCSAAGESKKLAKETWDWTEKILKSHYNSNWFMQI